MRRRLLLVIPIVLIASLAMAQQSAEQPQFLKAEEVKLVSSPVMPECASFVIQHGDPKAGSSISLMKFASGCTVPMHWHSANEHLMFVSGTGQIEMKGEQPHTWKAGDYVFNPARHAHQLSCASGCTLHRYVEGPIDIHYIDAAGNEITTEKAMAAFGERPGAAIAKK